MEGFTDSHVFTLLNNIRHELYNQSNCGSETGEAEGENLGSFQQRMLNIEQVDICGCENLSSDAVNYGHWELRLSSSRAAVFARSL
jgi:hypothetical protein